MSSVGICVPHGGTVNPALYRHLFTLQGQLQTMGWQVHYLEIELAGVAKARNLMVQQCLDLHLDRVHFVDDDVLLPANAYLLYEHEAPIVSGLYMARQVPHTPQMYERSPMPEHEGKYWPILNWTADLLEVDAVGAGCLLVTTDTFLDMEAKWNEKRRLAADYITHASDGVREVLGLGMTMSPWFEFSDHRGEDFYFCERARAAGHRVLVDTRVQCIHMGKMPLTTEYFLKLRDNGLLAFAPEAK